MIINFYVLAIFDLNQGFVMIRSRPLTTPLIRFSLFYQRCIKFYLTFLMFDSKRIFFASLQIKFNLSNNYWNYGKKAKTLCRWLGTTLQKQIWKIQWTAYLIMAKYMKFPVHATDEISSIFFFPGTVFIQKKHSLLDKNANDT